MRVTLAISAAVRGRFSSPAVRIRSVLWPTCRMTFTAVAGKLAA